MSDENIITDNLSNQEIKGEIDSGEESEHEFEYYGEGTTIIALGGKSSVETLSEGEKREWVNLGEYGEARYYIHAGEAEEYPPVYGEYESSVTSAGTVVVSEVEETEEEKELRRERELLIDTIKQRIMERMLLRRRNAFLHKKLIEHYKKRRMENVLKEEPKGLDLENKYLKRLYAFKEFKQAQENEIDELTNNMQQLQANTEQLKEELNEKLINFVNRAKEVSLNLILSKSGKKVNEKTIDHLLKRFIKKNHEKGKKKLNFIKIKSLIDDKEINLKAMEYFENGLHIADYEQLKIDNQNFTDKIEEKEEELTKMRCKAQGIIQHLAHVREKSYAVEGDIELMEEKVYDVERTVTETRERLTHARKKRDTLRDEFSHLKSVSGLLTKTKLLRDFEDSIAEAHSLRKALSNMKKAVSDRNKRGNELSKLVYSSQSEIQTFREKKPAEKSPKLQSKLSNISL